MKIKLLCLLLVFIMASCNDKDIIEIGKEINAEDLNSLPSSYSMISSGEIAKVYEISINNIKFHFAIDSSNKIKYIETRDPNFKSVEGVLIGHTLKKLHEVTSKEVTKQPGWGYSVELLSDWNALFFVGSTGTDSLPADTAKVNLFYSVKRNY